MKRCEFVPVNRAGSVLLSIYLACLAAAAYGGTTNTTVDATNRWAWASPCGWINCRTDTTNGLVFGQFVCSGYMWSSGTGWINVGNGNPTNKVRYTNLSTNDYGINCYSNGLLRGYAWSPTYGWISFENTGAPKVDFRTGVVSGYAWNSSLGWISFTNVTGFLASDSIYAGADTNGNTIPDAWELTYTNVLGKIGTNSTMDLDGDGETDRDEYIAGTHPLDSSSYLRITGVTGFGGTNDLTWTCVPTRTYLVETNTSLTGGSGWGPCGLGEISTNSISSATVRLPMESATNCFYRIKVFLPLSLP